MTASPLDAAPRETFPTTRALHSPEGALQPVTVAGFVGLPSASALKYELLEGGTLGVMLIGLPALSTKPSYLLSE